MEQEMFTLAVQQYQDMVFRIALHYFADPDDADDAVQEVFLRLFQRKTGFDSEEHMKHWLMRVTVNHCKDILKSPWRKRRVGMESAENLPVFDKPEQMVLFQEVMSLSEKYRTVLYLFYYEELTVKEIASVLKLRQSAVTTRLSRARALLKKRLGEAWNNE